MRRVGLGVLVKEAGPKVCLAGLADMSALVYAMVRSTTDADRTRLIDYTQELTSVQSKGRSMVSVPSPHGLFGLHLGTGKNVPGSVGVIWGTGPRALE